MGERAHWKRIILLVLGCIAASFVVGCNPWGFLSAHSQGTQVFQSGGLCDTSAQLSQAELGHLIEGMDRFALDLYQALRNDPRNLFFSPYSISLALAMAYAGARGETAAQIAKALHFTLTQERLHPAFSFLDLKITSRVRTGLQLAMANAFWGQLGHRFLQEYIDLLAGYYGAEIHLVDFQSTPDPCREHINRWVSEKTQEKIEELLPPGSVTPETRLVLTNAIYFKGTWRYEFDPQLTAERPFALLDGSQVMVPMMEQQEVWLPYAQGSLDALTYQAVELPYVGEELSMVIILPELEQFAKFEEALNAKRLGTILNELLPREVDLIMPKFSFACGFDLKETLSKLGMPLAFSEGADFSGTDGQRGLWLGGVYHKAFIEVNEEGTEAAAATGITKVLAAPYEFQANHPFIFLIRDRETGAILFLGRVLNPAGGEPGPRR